MCFPIEMPKFFGVSAGTSHPIAWPPARRISRPDGWPAAETVPGVQEDNRWAKEEGEVM